MSRQIATFILGETILGVDILLVKEVYRHKNFTPIPDAPEHFKGLMNLRGRVVTVIDLNVCLNRPPAENIDNCRLLILKTEEEIAKYIAAGRMPRIKLGDDIVGFLIDSMDDVLDLEDDQILPPPPNLKEVDEAMIDGVVKRGEQLVILLDIEAVLNEIVNAISEAVS